MPLNFDWQQVLLHWMNLAILTGGLYLLLYKPVKTFMDKREEHYRELERQAAEKLAEAEQLKAECQTKLEDASEEIRQSRIKVQQAAQKSAQEQLEQAQAEAKRIIAKAHTEAEQNRDRVRRESQRELQKLAAQAAKKLAASQERDPFDQFLDLAEGGGTHEGG